MEVPHCQAHLHKPTQDLFLAEGTTALLGFSNSLGQISALRVLHDDVEPALRGAVHLPEPDDVRMAQKLQYFGLSHRVCLLLGREVGEVDLLHRPLLPRRHLAHQVGPAV